MMQGLVQDLKQAVRALRAGKLVTALGVLSLGLAMGATTVIFGVVFTTLLHPLPYDEPDRLVMVWERDLANPSSTRLGKSVPPGLLPMSAPNFEDFRRHEPVFEALGSYFAWNATIAGDGSLPQRVPATVVSHDLFDEVLEVQPVLGRGFGPEDTSEGNDQVLLLSYGLWQNRYGSDRSVLGSTVRLEGLEFQVVGVMPPGFNFPNDSEVWKPLVLPDAPRRFSFLRGVGRLREGLTIDGAQREMEEMVSRLAERYPAALEDRGIWVQDLTDYVVGDVRIALWSIFGAVGFVLLIACVNVGNLLLARGVARRAEIAVRAAIGAGRGRIIRQLLLEALVLASLGGTFGLVLAAWAFHTLVPLAGDVVPRLDEATIDARLVLFTLALNLATALVAGIGPTLRASRPRIVEVLKSTREPSGGRRGLSMQRGTVVLQVALAAALLIGTGLLGRTLQELHRTEPGFDPEGLLGMELNLSPPERYGDNTTTTAFFDELLRRAEALPGVESAGITWRLPLKAGSGLVNLDVEGIPESEGELVASPRPVSSGYFETLGTPLVAGRGFTERDDVDAPGVVVVNEALARQIWGTQSPLGEKVTFSVDFGPAGSLPSASREVVGVVGNVHSMGLDEEEPPEIYFPIAAATWRWSSLVVRTSLSDPYVLAEPLREELRRMNPDLSFADIKPMAEVIDESLFRPQLNLALMACFGGLGLVLALVGIYGVLSYWIARKSRELGLQMALGADRRRVLREVLAEAARLTAVGILGGCALAYGFSRYIESLLYRVSVLDAAVFTAVPVLLLLTALLASYLPARRATAVDPAVTLRSE